jgi:hypothetical protein
MNRPIRDQWEGVAAARLACGIDKPKEDNMSNGIGWAVKNMWDGKRVTRTGWNGKDMYLELQRPDKFSKMTVPYVYMKTVQGDLVPWLCSQTDLLAFDWELVKITV